MWNVSEAINYGTNFVFLFHHLKQPERDDDDVCSLNNEIYYNKFELISFCIKFNTILSIQIALFDWNEWI